MTFTPGSSTALLRSRCVSSPSGIVGLSKYLVSGQTRTRCRTSASAFGIRRQRLGDLAVLEHQPVHAAVAPDHDFQPGGQRVGDGHAHAVQTAGERIGASALLVELAAGVQAGEHQFNHRRVFFRVQSHWYAAAVVLDGYAAIGVQRDLYLFAVAGQRLVGGVVDHLLHDAAGSRCGCTCPGAGARAPAPSGRGWTPRCNVEWPSYPQHLWKKPTFYGQAQIPRGSRWDAQDLSSPIFGRMTVMAAALSGCFLQDLGRRAATSYTKPQTLLLSTVVCFNPLQTRTTAWHVPFRALCRGTENHHHERPNQERQ